LKVGVNNDPKGIIYNALKFSPITIFAVIVLFVVIIFIMIDFMGNSQK